MELKIPGKTFLVGEYAVLVGGEALGLGTQPCFQVSVKNPELTVHPQSAAGLFLKSQHNELNLNMENPYGVGGFGLSTAEFIAAWFNVKKHPNLKDIFETYQMLFADSRASQKPSGADLITQLLGQVTHFRTEVQNSKSQPWPFENLSFYLVSTGLKVATHEHLAKLDRTKLEDLKPLSEKVISLFQKGDADSFLMALSEWSLYLAQKGLLHPNAATLKTKIESLPLVLQVKPCGALGADVFLVFCLKDDKKDVKNKLQSLNLKVQASEIDLVSGPMLQESEAQL